MHHYRFTTKSMYLAALVANEVVWIQKCVRELGIVPSIKGSIDIYCDNNGVSS